MISLVSLMLMLMPKWSAGPIAALDATAAFHHGLLGQPPEPPGKAPYARVCQVCHGAEGRGDAGVCIVRAS